MKLCLIHPMDPLGNKIGGAESFARGVLRYTPEGIRVGMIGLSSADDRGDVIQKWQINAIDGREFDFLPLFIEKTESHNSFIPLSLRFTWKLLRCAPDWRERVVLFNRVEPALLKTPGASVRTAIVHNDIRAQLHDRGSDVKWKYLPFLYHAMEKRVFQSLDHVFCVHRQTVDYYLKRYPGIGDRFSHLPTWFDPELFQISKRDKIELRMELRQEQPELPLTGKWLLFCGRFERQKNLLCLIDAFCMAFKKMPDIWLVLVGAGSMRAQIEERAGKLRERLIFTGVKSRFLMPLYYQAADLLVLSSHYEGMPLTVLEALACGLPVVSTPAGEVPHLVSSGEQGEISPDFSAQGLSRTVLKALARKPFYDPATCRRSVEPYCPEAILSKMLNFLGELASPRGGQELELS